MATKGKFYGEIVIRFPIQLTEWDEKTNLPKQALKAVKLSQLSTDIDDITSVLQPNDVNMKKVRIYSDSKYKNIVAQQ